MPSIVTVTLNPAVDVSVSVDRVSPEHKLRTDQPQRDPGGGGLNVCRAIHYLGGQATALWLSGGHAGRLLADLLDAENIRHQAVEIQADTRENVTVYERSSDHQFRFTMPGPRVTPTEADCLLDHVAHLEVDYLVLSGSLPPGLPDDFYARVIRAAPEGTRVVMDTSGEPLRQAGRAGAYLLKPNFRELSQLVDRPIEDDDQVEHASRELIDAGHAHAVVTSLGAGGAVLVWTEGVDLVRAPTVPIRSKVGAGDSMVAGMVLALARGEPLTRAVRFGVAAGAAAVMTEGTRLCRREDAERLFGQLLDHERPPPTEGDAHD